MYRVTSRQALGGLPRTVAVLFLAALSANAQSANPVPSISLPLTPGVVAPGSAGFVLTVNGTGFVSKSTVTWKGVDLLTTFVTASQLTAEVPASKVSSPGSAQIAVMNPGPGRGKSNVVPFLVTVPNAAVGFTPSIPDISPFSFTVLADFNGDGNLDSAGVNFNNNQVGVALGRSDGSFGSPTIIDLPASSPRLIVTGDFNGDHKPDLAVLSCNEVNCDTGGILSILPGNGDGTFGAPVTSQLSDAQVSEQMGFVAVDLNGDGVLDLAMFATIFTQTNTPASLFVLLGNGDGTFRPGPPIGSGFPDLESITTISSGDFNGDGKPDLAIGVILSPGSPRGVEILNGNGDGSFSVVGLVELSNGSVAPASIAFGDLNHDGIQDLVATDGFRNVFVALGMGHGRFAVPAIYPIEPRQDPSPQGIAIGDFNGDGLPDLAVGEGGLTNMSILFGRGDGTFPPALTYPTGAPTALIGAADVNKDGLLDVVFLSSNGLVTFLQNTVLLSPTALTFPPQGVGGTGQPQTVTLTQIVSRTLHIQSITFTGANAGDFSQTNTCGGSVASGGNCKITVTFTPTASGTRSATLTINDSGPGSPQSVSLTGTGLVPQVNLNVPGLTWSTQSVGSPAGFRQFRITNIGNTGLSITSFGITGVNAGDFAITHSNCATSLAPNKFCSPTVRFTPQGAGPRTATLTITDNAPGSPQTLPLAGTGTFVALSTESVNFGSLAVGQSSTPVAVKITNIGPAAFSLTSIALGGFNSGDYSQTNDCPPTLNAGATCTATITFTPATTGTFVATLIVADSDAGSPQKVFLMGTGR